MSTVAASRLRWSMIRPLEFGLGHSRVCPVLLATKRMIRNSPAGASQSKRPSPSMCPEMSIAGRPAGTASTATSFERAVTPSGSGTIARMRPGPLTGISRHSSLWLAFSGLIHAPPAFQLLEANNPSSRPRRFAWSMAWEMLATDSGPRKAGPAGMIFFGSRRLPTSQIMASPSPLAFNSSSSRVN